MCQPKYLPSAVQCYNMGTDGFDVQWRCDAELDNDVAFDAVHVSCEGFLDADDPYVLDGSCGLEYKLKFTNTYHDRVRKAKEEQAAQRRANSRYTTGNEETGGGDEFLAFVFVCGVILVLVWFCAMSKKKAPAPTATSFQPSAPPMYETPQGTAPQSVPGMDATTAAGLGFAAGAATGAAAAHVIHSYHVTTEHQPSTAPSYATSRFTRVNTSDHSSSTTRSSSSPTSSTSPSSGGTHTSKGFGTSSRR